MAITALKRVSLFQMKIGMCECDQIIKGIYLLILLYCCSGAVPLADLSSTDSSYLSHSSLSVIPSHMLHLGFSR